MDWSTIFMNSIFNLGMAIIIVVAYAGGGRLGVSNRANWKNYLLVIFIVGFLAVGIASEYARGAYIDGPDPFMPGGVRDPSTARYVSKEERYGLGLKIFFTLAPPALIGVYIGTRKKSKS